MSLRFPFSTMCEFTFLNIHIHSIATLKMHMYDHIIPPHSSSPTDGPGCGSLRLGFKFNFQFGRSLSFYQKCQDGLFYDVVKSLLDPNPYRQNSPEHITLIINLQFFRIRIQTLQEYWMRVATSFQFLCIIMFSALVQRQDDCFLAVSIVLNFISSYRLNS